MEKRLKSLGIIGAYNQKTKRSPTTPSKPLSLQEIFCHDKLNTEGAGRPRAAWTYETMKDCWRRKFHNIAFEIQNREHREQIKTWALNRERSFLTVIFSYRTNSCCSGANGSHPDLWFEKKESEKQQTTKHKETKVNTERKINNNKQKQQTHKHTQTNHKTQTKIAYVHLGNGMQTTKKVITNNAKPPHNIHKTT